MSLTGARPSDVSAGFIHTANGESCFYCGTALQDPALHWMGATGDIFLHPGCFVDLSTHLFRDLHEWQRQRGLYFGETK